MNPVTVGGAPVLGLTVCLPRVGCWHADAVVDDESKLSGAVTVDLGSLQLQGFVLTGAPYANAGYYRIVGGAGGIGGSKTATPRAFGACPLSQPLRALLGDLGEELDGTADQGVLSTPLAGWTTLGAPAGRQLAVIIQAAPKGTAWRFLPSGKLWVGPETWPDSGATYEELGQLPHEGRIEIGEDFATLQPGTTLSGTKVSYVEHRLDSGKLRTLVLAEPS